MGTTSIITQMLDALAELENQRAVVLLDKQALIDSILTPEIKAQLADINDEFADKTTAVDENISNLKGGIQAAVLEVGASVKGQYMQAVYTKPRVSWDTDRLEGYATAHPELLSFRKVGRPSVSFRVVK